jgi:hypothetical protein
MDSPTPVPTLSSWALFSLILLILAMVPQALHRKEGFWQDSMAPEPKSWLLGRPAYPQLTAIDVPQAFDWLLCDGVHSYQGCARPVRTPWMVCPVALEGGYNMLILESC